LRSDDVATFQVLLKRWIVERTFAWLGRYRRLSKDYEQVLENSEGMVLSITCLNALLRPTDFQTVSEQRLREIGQNQRWYDLFCFHSSLAQTLNFDYLIFKCTLVML
jgi:hypothetical protein